MLASAGFAALVVADELLATSAPSADLAPDEAFALAEVAPEVTWNVPPPPCSMRDRRSSWSVTRRVSLSLVMAATAAPSLRRNQARVLVDESL